MGHIATHMPASPLLINADCLTATADLPSASVDQIVSRYVDDSWTLRRIAQEHGTSHHKIRRVLTDRGVEVMRKGRKRAPFSQAHRAAISKSAKGRACWSTGLTMTQEFKRTVMASKLGTKRTLSADAYPHFEKLKLLTRLTSRHKLHASDELRFAFIDRFYVDAAFNAVYDAWELNGKSKWWFPSIDHIDPKASGGRFEIDNLRFITWFENRAKAEMSLAAWELLKRNTNMRSDLFIESILCGAVAQ